MTKLSVIRPESCKRVIPWPVLGSFSTDLLGRITREVSQRALDYLGISKGEGQPFATLVFANVAQACGQWTETYRTLIMQPLSKFEQAANHLARSVELIHPHTGRRKYFLYYFLQGENHHRHGQDSGHAWRP